MSGKRKGASEKMYDKLIGVLGKGIEQEMSIEDVTESILYVLSDLIHTSSYDLESSIEDSMRFIRKAVMSLEMERITSGVYFTMFR